MPSILPTNRLQRVSISVKKTIQYHKEGVSLEADSAQTIDQIMLKVAADRWHLATRHRATANRLMNGDPPSFRDAVSRYYYAMYHSLRACLFSYHRGDDFQKHSDLPLNIPPDFDPGVNWEQTIKNARLTRNRADYDLYPKSNAAWRADAILLRTDALRLMRRARTYLIGKGCQL
jgi:uncharacterized protein (UPF0332 family)